MSKSATATNQPTEVKAPNNGQRLFLAYTLFILVDLTVLMFFDQYWDLIKIESFTIAFLAAALLQVLLRRTRSFRWHNSFHRRRRCHYSDRSNSQQDLYRVGRQVGQ